MWSDMHSGNGLSRIYCEIKAGPEENKAVCLSPAYWIGGNFSYDCSVGDRPYDC